MSVRRRGRLAAWAVASGLALATHYDAALLVVPEAIWLLAVHRHRLGAWLPVAFVGGLRWRAAAAAYRAEQRHNTSWIKKAPLNDRLGQILPQFLLGTGLARVRRADVGRHSRSGALGLLLLARFASSSERNWRSAMGTLAVGGFALVMIVDAAGTDTVLTRNLLALWLPVAIVLAAGLERGPRRPARRRDRRRALRDRRHGDSSVATDATLQRPDWPAVARALGPWPRAGQPPDANRLLVFQRNVWLESLTHVYMTRTHRLRATGAREHRRDRVIANSSPPGRK